MAVLRERAVEVKVRVRVGRQRRPLQRCAGFMLVPSAVPVSSEGVSQPGRIPDGVRTVTAGPGGSAPALQRIPGPAAESHLAAEEVWTR